jgi:hypothetical protein
VAGGGTGLDFTCFLKFLVMIAYHALSKTNSFSSMYSTIEVSAHGLCLRVPVFRSIDSHVPF